MIVIRTLGGRARHALKDIMTLDCFVSIKGIIIVHHTDCGATRFRDAAVKKVLKERVPDHAEEIDGMEFGEISE
jgi:carbonic anhydrase